MQKTITFRAKEDDLERINQIKETFKKEYRIRTITTSDVISAGIMELWSKECLPYKQGKITF